MHGGVLLPAAWGKPFCWRGQCRGWDFGNVAWLDPRKTWARRGRSFFTLSGFAGQDSTLNLEKQSENYSFGKIDCLVFQKETGQRTLLLETKCSNTSKDLQQWSNLVMWLLCLVKLDWGVFGSWSESHCSEPKLWGLDILRASIKCCVIAIFAKVENAVKTFNQVFSCSLLHLINQQLHGETKFMRLCSEPKEICAFQTSHQKARLSKLLCAKKCKLLNVQSGVGKEFKK